MRNPSRTCDCGNPGEKKDGSGWYCSECETMIQRVTRLLIQIIKEQRQETFKSESGGAMRGRYAR